MYQRYKERFGTVGVVLGVVALILALGGTALAASKLTGTQKKEVSKIAKKEAQKYANSNPGAPGANGKDGTNGANGTNGTGATTETFAGNANGCTEGGLIVKSSSPDAVICNGKKGTNGTNGTNGQTGFTETLPSEETETGNWSAVGFYVPEELVPFPISYSIPLSAPSTNVEYLNLQETKDSVGSGGCELDVEDPAATPIAPSDTLCVFTQSEPAGEVASIGFGGDGSSDTPAGTFVLAKPVAVEGIIGAVNLAGTWAVTAK